MKTLSDEDARKVLRTLVWAATLGGPSVRDSERRRIAKKLTKKLEKTWSSKKEQR